jgi:hypothetical protein
MIISVEVFIARPPYARQRRNFGKRYANPIAAEWRPPGADTVCEHRAIPTYYASYFYKRWRGVTKQRN